MGSDSIWVVDDDRGVRAIFAQALAGAGYAVRQFVDGDEALAHLAGEPPLVVLLDVEMPRRDGWSTLHELRRRGCAAPVMMITSVNDTVSRVRGLDLGADDYLGKPCAADELLARVRALLRRPGRTLPVGDTLRLGDVTVDLAGKTARRGDQKLRLTRTDFALLRVLAAHRGRPVSRERIAAEVWGGVMTVQALNTHIWRLRAKLPPRPDGEPWIINQPGLGYLLAAEG